MKVALVQDWFTVDGGAEKVVKEILHFFPDADIFGLIDCLSDEDRKTILNGKKVFTSFIQNLPQSEVMYRNYLPFFPLAIEALDFSAYDLIVSSSYAVAKGIKVNPGQIHICYCHTPIRYAWDLRDEYLSQMGSIKRTIARPILKYIRNWDLKTSNNPTHYIANSENVAERIQRLYNRNATVIYPPVDTENFTYQEKKSDYYLTSARLVPYKKVNLIVEAFSQLPNQKLIVSGDGPQLEHLKTIAGPNVSFAGFLERKDLISHIQNAKAFILAAEEDFGITSVEAQSCGTPVIALNKGGYKETVVSQKTGVFFNNQTSESIADCIKTFENEKLTFKKEDFMTNVDKFSINKFRMSFQKVLNRYKVELV